jgi:hypothetical protein
MPLSVIKVTLLATLAAALIWRAVAVQAESNRFGLRATVGSSRVEVTLALPLLCVRVSAHLAEPLVAVSANRECSRCESLRVGRSWS